MARLKKRLTYELLKYHFNYDPETGDFTWRRPRVSWTPVGSRAGWTNNEGYRVVRVYGYGYRVARLAWLYMTGEWPEDEVDHEDQNRSNDRWDNLRPATRKQNVQNSRKRNKLGAPGVSQAEGGFTARATILGVRTYLGYFTDLADAVEAVAAARLGNCKEFACLEAK